MWTTHGVCCGVVVCAVCASSLQTTGLASEPADDRDPTVRGGVPALPGPAGIRARHVGGTVLEWAVGG